MTADQIIAAIDARAAEIAEFCAALVRAPSPNPPGDTREAAALVRALLERHGHAVENIADQEYTPNLVAQLRAAEPGPVVSLIGHMDTYPAGDAAQWQRAPFSGALVDGRLHGRGAGDMKSGLTALIFAFLVLAERGLPRGGLNLLAVSDEMNFSPHGARFLLAQRPDLLGDAALDGEPTSPEFVLFGEKGMLWVELTCTGESASSAFAPQAASAIDRMTELLSAVQTLRTWEPQLAPEIRAALAADGGTAGTEAAARTYVDDAVLPLTTVNTGLIQGGRKINLVADRCTAEVDIRVPPGVALERAVAALDAICAARPYASYRIIQQSAPNWTDPEHPLIRAVARNAGLVRGTSARREIGITASDTRLFRAHGVPAALYGPRIFGQGQPNESIAVQDLIDVTKVFALSAYDTLAKM